MCIMFFHYQVTWIGESSKSRDAYHWDATIPWRSHQLFRSMWISISSRLVIIYNIIIYIYVYIYIWGNL